MHHRRAHRYLGKDLAPGPHPPPRGCPDPAALQSLGCVLYCMMFGEGPYDTIFQKGDSVALAVQNPITVPPTTR